MRPKFPLWFRNILDACLANMDIGDVQKFCVALRREDAAVFHTEAFETAFDVAFAKRLRKRAKRGASAAAADILAALAMCKDVALDACRKAWVSMAKVVQGWSEDYAADEFDRYVVRRCRGAECGDYTVTALPRLLELFELQ